MSNVLNGVSELATAGLLKMFRRRVVAKLNSISIEPMPLLDNIDSSVVQKLVTTNHPVFGTLKNLSILSSSIVSYILKRAISLTNCLRITSGLAESKLRIWIEHSNSGFCCAKPKISQARRIQEITNS